MKYKNLTTGLITFSLLLAGCAKEQETRERSASLILNLKDNPTSLDPRTVRILRDLTLAKELFEGLMVFDEHQKLRCGCAENVIISDDQLTYTFHLRPCLWSNGEPVTSSDFEYAWKSILHPDFPTDYAQMLYPIKHAKEAKIGRCSLGSVGIQCEGDHTLIVELEHPTPYFLELMAFPTTFPVYRNIDAIDPNWMVATGSKQGKPLISNGPFLLEEWTPDFSLTLKKNLSYWNQENISLESIKFFMVKDPLTESYLYEKGELDWQGLPLSHAIPNEILGQLKAKGELKSYSVAGSAWLEFNTQKPPFDNQKMRKAFASLVIRKEIVDQILERSHTLASGILPPSMSFKNEEKLCENDTLAQEFFNQYLHENGLTLSTLPQITFTHRQNHAKIAQFFASKCLEILGINLRLEVLESGSYQSKIKSEEFQFTMGEWVADFNDPMTFLEIFKDCKLNGSGMNNTGWQNKEYSTLVSEAQEEKDINKRLNYLKRAEEILLEDAPISPLYHYSFDYAKKEGIEGVVLSPLGIGDFRYVKKRKTL